MTHAWLAWWIEDMKKKFFLKKLSTDIVSIKIAVQVKSSAMKMKTEFLFYLTVFFVSSILILSKLWYRVKSKILLISRFFIKNFFTRFLRQKRQNKIPKCNVRYKKKWEEEKFQISQSIPPIRILWKMEKCLYFSLSFQ